MLPRPGEYNEQKEPGSALLSEEIHAYTQAEAALPDDGHLEMTIIPKGGNDGNTR
jgi:hypothetical protein